MIGNVIDHRKFPYKFKNVEAIMEPTWHDNSCKDSDQAEKGKGEGIGYQEFADISVSLAMLTAHKMDFMVTVYLYDVGTNVGRVPRGGKEVRNMKEQGVVHYSVYNKAAKNLISYLKGSLGDDFIITWPRSNTSLYGSATLKFMGYNPYTAQWLRGDPGTQLVDVPEESIPKYNLLTSPHYETLLKAWEVVNGPLIDTPLTSDPKVSV